MWPIIYPRVVFVCYQYTSVYSIVFASSLHIQEAPDDDAAAPAPKLRAIGQVLVQTTYNISTYRLSMRTMVLCIAICDVPSGCEAEAAVAAATSSMAVGCRRLLL